MAVTRAHVICMSLFACAIVGGAAACGPTARLGGSAAGTKPAAVTRPDPVARPDATTKPDATAMPVAGVQPPSVAVLDSPFGASPNTMRLIGLDGSELARIDLRPDAEAIAVAGPRVLIAGGGRIESVDRGGRATELGTLPDDSSGDLVRGLVASPDGSRWMWAALHVLPNGSTRSRIYLGDGRSAPRLLLERTEQGRTLQPVAWTAGGAVLSDALDGIGGYVLFRRTFGPASLLNMATTTLTPLTPDACAFSDLAADGAVSCIVDGREGPNDGGPVRLMVQRAGTTPINGEVPAGMQQAGNALFQPQGTLVTLSVSPASGTGQTQVRTELIDARTGTIQPVGFSGLTPVQWIDPSSMLMVRDQAFAGGPPGTYVARTDGTLTVLSSHPYAVGLVH